MVVTKIRIYSNWRYGSIFQGISPTNLIQRRYDCYMKIWLHNMRDIHYKSYLGKPKYMCKIIQVFLKICSKLSMEIFKLQISREKFMGYNLFVSQFSFTNLGIIFSSLSSSDFFFEDYGKSKNPSNNIILNFEFPEVHVEKFKGSKRFY